MEHALSDDPRAIKEDIISAILDRLPPERRLLGMTPRDRIAGMNEEEKKQLRDLLEQEQQNGSSD